MEAVCSFCLAKSGVISYDSFMKTTTLSTNSRHRPLGRSGLLSISLLIGCFGLLPRAQAVGPDTDGNIPGSNNGEGIGVLVSRTGGVWNTGTGFEALNHLTAGNQNTATGLRALNNDTNGGYNTATGVLSLFSNTSGFFNSATGAYSLANNTANGVQALFSNTTGNLNTANGLAALRSNTTGIGNTAEGGDALVNNTTGEGNTAIGVGALSQNTIGNANIAVGHFAGHDLTTGDQNIVIGNANAVAGESNTIRIGGMLQTATYIAGISGQAAIGGDAVLVTDSGKLGTVNLSSERFKDQIKPMDKASEAILALKPVTFRYKKEIDPQGIPQFGLVAEEVDKVSPDLVKRDARGAVYTVRYDAVNAMLLNEFLKAHRTIQEQNHKIQEQEATITELKKGIEILTAQFKEQAAQIQKVSAQLEVSRPAPRTVLNK